MPRSILVRATVTLLGIPFLLLLQACSWLFPPAQVIADPCSVSVPRVDKPSITLEQIVSDLFNPVYLTHAGDRSGRLFVVEQDGTMRIIQQGKTLPTPFLDLRDRVESGDEKGLLSVAFHPNFTTNRRFYVDYTTRQAGQLKVMVAEYQVSAADPNVADPASARILLEIKKPFDNHN